MSPPAIPKRLHFIWWQGFQHLPAHFARFIEGWKQLHPAWDLYLWDRAKLDALIATLPGPAPGLVRTFMAAYTHDIQRIDFARLLILHALGGAYCDVDLLCLRPIDALLKPCTFYLCREQEPFVSFCNAFLAATPQHPVLDTLMQTLFRAQHRQAESFDGNKALMVLHTTGPRVITPVLLNLAGEAHPGVRLDMDPATLYPVPWTRDPIPQDPEQLRERFPSSYAVHMWSGSWHAT